MAEVPPCEIPAGIILTAPCPTCGHFVIAHRQDDRRCAICLMLAERNAPAVLLPGNVLVLETDNDLSMAQAEHIRQSMLERSPELNDVVVLAGGIRVARVEEP